MTEPEAANPYADHPATQEAEAILAHLRDWPPPLAMAFLLRVLSAPDAEWGPWSPAELASFAAVNRDGRPAYVIEDSAGRVYGSTLNGPTAAIRAAALTSVMRNAGGLADLLVSLHEEAP